MYWPTLHFLTYFGDSMLLIPTAIVMAVLMTWKSSERRTVWYWCLVFCATGAIVSLTKVAFMGFGFGSAHLNFTGVSGHTAMSATLWPVMLWLLSGRFSGTLRILAVAFGYLIPILVGVSRLLLSYHSTSEVVTGLILGFTLSSAFLVSQRSVRLQGFSALQLSVALLLPLLLLSQGRLATTQQFLQRLSVQIAGIEHPWTRGDLLKLRQ